MRPSCGVGWPPLAPPGMAVVTLDEARLPEVMLTNPRKYLDTLNFANNYVFFRDADGLSTRLVTANYWAGLRREIGPPLASAVRRNRGGAGRMGAGACHPVSVGVVIDSAEVRARFGLPAFRGQLFVHAIGVAGHDVVKYALDTYGIAGQPSLSCTHDANAWPSDRYAGLPAPREGRARGVVGAEQSRSADPGRHACRSTGWARSSRSCWIARSPPFATLALDVAELFPTLRWPAHSWSSGRGGIWFGRAMRWCKMAAPASPT